VSRNEKPSVFFGVALASVLAASPATSRAEGSAIFGFEGTGASGGLLQWVGKPSGPDGTVFLDSTVVHGGRIAVRIERDARSAGGFSSIALPISIAFTGSVLELRGWVKYDAVDGFIGLWQRQDTAQDTAQFDNMEARGLRGTADWHELRLELPLDDLAQTVTIGALLAGTGRLWVDDLQLLVDGKPVESPTVRKTIHDTDHEFDGGSSVSIDHVSETQIANLVLLAKVWGFLKYHHPEIVQGRRHWDYDLFRVLPKILAARDRTAAQIEMSAWVARLGEAPPCTACVPTPEGLPVLPRLGWLADRTLLGGLSDPLRHTYANRERRSTQFYVSHAPGVGNPDFGNELAYEGMTVPDAGYRLLGLFRAWNIVEYWFPYRDLVEADGDALLREFIPRVVSAGSRDEYALAMIAFFSRLEDGHANLWKSLDVRPPTGACQLPLAFRFVEGRLVVSGYTHPSAGSATGLRIGDVVSRLDDVPVDSLVARWWPVYAASNDAARLRAIAASIGRGACEGVRLTVERPASQEEVLIERLPIDSLDARGGSRRDHAGDGVRRLSEELAYLTLASVRASQAEAYVRAAAGAKVLLLDLRTYPSEFVVFALGQHLVENPAPFALFTAGSASDPGSFAWTDSIGLEPAPPRFEGTVAILVDESSMSQSEYTAMAFRTAPGAIVVGSQTAGADGNVSEIPLPGGLSGLMSGIGVFHPDRRPTQRIGIVPDVVVHPTIEGLRAGRDEVLEAAVEHLLGRPMTEKERKALEAAS